LIGIKRKQANTTIQDGEVVHVHVLFHIWIQSMVNSQCWHNFLGIKHTSRVSNRCHSYGPSVYHHDRDSCSWCLLWWGKEKTLGYVSYSQETSGKNPTSLKLKTSPEQHQKLSRMHATQIFFPHTQEPENTSKLSTDSWEKKSANPPVWSIYSLYIHEREREREREPGGGEGGRAQPTIKAQSERD
jgi:hypothetical protein